MTNSQLNQLDMFRSVHHYCLKSPQLIENIPPFVSGVNTLGQIISAITNMDTLLSLRPGETAREKNNIRVALCRITASAIASGRSFAENTQDAKLGEGLQISLTELKSVPAENLAEVVRGLFNLVHPLAPRLALYGLTSGIFNAWNHVLSTYSPNLKSPRAAMLQRKNLTICFAQLFKDGAILCTDFLDPLAESVKKKDAGFLKGYLLARILVNTAITGASIKGHIKSSDPEYLLSDVSITLVENGIIVKSDEEGSFFFRAVKKGTYTLRAEKAGYYTKTSPVFELKEGESVQIDFDLNRAEVLQH
jgi:hypothetical protein